MLRLISQRTPSFSRFRKPHPPAWSTIACSDTSIAVHSLNATFPYVWLRDSCQEPSCVHPSTSQKLHRTSDIPLDIRPAADGVHLTSDGLRIQWADGHTSFFHASFLERHSSPTKLFDFHKDVNKRAWNHASVTAEGKDLFLPYQSLETPTGLLVAMTQLAQYGLVFISGVPNAETTNETCELRTLAERFGEIRPTFYGPLWDVKNIRNSRNIAYTNLDLGLHMDLLYFEHPPRYQILHCLRNRVQGGTSVFVDAFNVANILRQTHPADFDVLANTPVAFHYINDGHHLHHEHPTIELSRDTSEVSHINYSPPFQAPLPLATPAPFYPAFKRFADLLNKPANTYQYTLQEGDAVMFDNRRVLHARTAFSDLDGSASGSEGETNRWLKGCYVEADAVMDRRRVLSTKTM
ncbi:Clavaminate synthase-like protein [Infundibulicybe gibba]|nr:Clavaminate synthase-like protein [Infundibulicybe gibba]